MGRGRDPGPLRVPTAGRDRGALHDPAVYQGGYRAPSGAFCHWTLVRGDETRLDANHNEHYAEIKTTRSPVDGVCTEWTFTLPWTSPRGYTWSLCIAVDSASDCTPGTFLSEATSFTAALGSTDRHVRESNIPVYYLLPSDTMAAVGEAVTYRLFASGGGSPPQDGQFWCDPSGGFVDGPPPGYKDQHKTGGTSFTCRPVTSGPWVAGWVRERGLKRWRSQYDPLSDRRKPTVTAPIARVGSALTPTADVRPVQVAWTGSDKGTGIARYQLQVSRDGRRYVSVALPSNKATAIDRRFRAGSTYQFRVRARDRAGNWSGWVYGPTVRASLHQETSRSITWSPGWIREAAPGASGGAVRATGAGGSVTVFRFTGRAVAWFARRAPAQGFAQVWVDGVLASTVSLGASTTQPSRPVWRRNWGSSGSHVVRILVLGTAGRERVELDAFEVIR